jgi:hypothetical protein
MGNFRNLGFLTNFSNKKILSIFLLLASIIISMFVNNQINQLSYSYTQMSPSNINEGMADCSGNNIIYNIINDTGPLPYQKLNTIRQFISSFESESLLNSEKIMEILNSQTDSDVVKIDKLKKKLDDLDLCANTEEDKKKSKK